MPSSPWWSTSASPAVLYLVLHAGFLFVVQIMVYAGAIMVLFLFVVMILGRRDTSVAEPLVGQRVLGVGALAILGGLLVWSVSSVNGLAGPPVAAVPAEFGSPVQMGEALFRHFTLPFELVGVLILVGVLGAVVLGQFGRGMPDPGASRRRRGGRLMVPTNQVLMLAAALFTIGVAGVVLRRNLILVLMSLELMLNSVNVTLVALSRAFGTVDAQLYVFFSLSVAAAEVAVGLALVVAVYRALGRSNVDDVSVLHG